MKYYKDAYGGVEYPKLSKKELCKEIDILKEALRRLVSQVKAMATELGYTFSEEWVPYRSAHWRAVVKIVKPTATEANKKRR